MSKMTLLLKELDCPHCAEKIEKRVGELSGVKSSNLDFINKKLTVDFDGDKNALFTQIENVVHKLEPDVSVKELGDCAEKTLYLKLEDLDCPNCGEKIANRVGELAGVISSNVDFISKKLTVKTDGSNPDLRIMIEDTVHQLEPDVTVKDYGAQTAEEEPVNDHKGEIVKLSVAIVFFIASMLLDKLGSGTVCEYLSAGLAIVAYLIAGLDVVIAAVRNLVKGEAFDESLLMTIATVGAFALKDFREGAAVMMFSSIVISGIQLITKWPLSPRNVTIVSVALGVGYGLGSNSAVLAQLPESINLIFGGSGIVPAALFAIILNIILPKDEKTEVEMAEEILAEKKEMESK